MKSIRIFYLKMFIFLVLKFSMHLNRRVFVMFSENTVTSFFYIIYTFVVIFLYNLYSIVWIQHDCLSNMVLAFAPSSSV